MKRLYLQLLTGITMLLLLGLSSCADSFESEDLVGAWQGVSMTGWVKVNGQIVEEWDETADDQKIVFNSNGTYQTYEKFYNSWQVDITEGTYSIKGKKLYLDEGDGDDYYVTIKSLTSDELILESNDTFTEDGTKYEEYAHGEYRRVSE